MSDTADMTAVLAGLEVRNLKEGDVLIEERGAPGDIYFLVEGSLGVYKGTEQVCVVEEKGAVFGESALLLERRNTATVKAVGPARVAVIPGVKEITELFAQKPAASVHIARVLARRVDTMNQFLLEVKHQASDMSESEMGAVRSIFHKVKNTLRVYEKGLSGMDVPM